MEKNNLKKILGIISILWGTFLLIYMILKNTVLSDIYADIYMKSALTQTTETTQALRLGYESLNNFILLAFLVSLILIVIFMVIYHKRRKIKIFSKETANNGSYFIYAGLLLTILIGMNLISMIFVAIGGFLFLKKD